jgi:hypothetical protein
VQIGPIAVSVQLPPWLQGAPVVTPETPSDPVWPGPRKNPSVSPSFPFPRTPAEPAPTGPFAPIRVKPFEPAAIAFPLARETSGALEQVGWVKLCQRPSVNPLPRFFVESTRWHGIEPIEHEPLAVPMRGLKALIASPLFEPTGSSDVILHARGPRVDLSEYAAALTLARRHRAEVVIVVHAPSEKEMPHWGPHR